MSARGWRVSTSGAGWGSSPCRWRGWSGRGGASTRPTWSRRCWIGCSGGRLRAGVADRVETLLCPAEALQLDDPADFALSVWSMHELENLPQGIACIRRCLKPEALFLVIEPIFHVPRALYEQEVRTIEAGGFVQCDAPAASLRPRGGLPEKPLTTNFTKDTKEDTDRLTQITADEGGLRQGAWVKARTTATALAVDPDPCPCLHPPSSALICVKRALPCPAVLRVRGQKLSGRSWCSSCRRGNIASVS